MAKRKTKKVVNQQEVNLDLSAIQSAVQSLLPTLIPLALKMQGQVSVEQPTPKKKRKNVKHKKRRM